MIFTSVPGAMPDPTPPRCASKARAFGPFRRQPAYRPVNAVRLWPQPRPQLAQLRIKLREELRIRVAAPGVVEHSFMPGRANANRQLIRRLCARKRRGHPIRTFNPQVSGVEHLGAGAQAMEDLAKEPFAGVRPAALGQILRPNLARQRGNLPRLGHPRVVFPKPSHRRRVLREPAVERQRLAIAIHRQRRAARGIHPDPDNLIRREASHRPLRQHECFLDRDFRPRDIVGGMLPGKVRIARQDNPLRTVFIIPNRGRHLTPVGDVHDQGPDGVGAVVEADGVLGCAHGPLS
jgi:hypothetical protein